MLRLLRAACLAVTFVVALAFAAQAASCLGRHAEIVTCCASDDAPAGAETEHDSACCALHGAGACLTSEDTAVLRSRGSMTFVALPGAQAGDGPVADIEHPPQLS